MEDFDRNIDISIPGKPRLICPQYTAQKHWVPFHIDEHKIFNVCPVLEVPGLHILEKPYVEQIKIAAFQHPQNGRLRLSNLRTLGTHTEIGVSRKRRGNICSDALVHNCTFLPFLCDASGAPQCLGYPDYCRRVCLRTRMPTL